jgi:hypothetical protein
MDMRVYILRTERFVYQGKKERFAYNGKMSQKSYVAIAAMDMDSEDRMAPS